MASCTIAGRVRRSGGGRVRKEGQGHTHLRGQEIEMCAFIHSSQHSFIEKCLLIPYVVFLWVPGPGQG